MNLIPFIAANISGDTEIFPYLNVFWIGTESNTAGQGSTAPNTLPSGEQAVRSTLILNNNTLAIESLHLGVNGLLDHWNLTDNSHWGMERIIANAVDAGTITGNNLIVKDGQGGTVISSRLSGTYYNKTLAKLAAVRTYCTANGYTPRLIATETQGINDMLATVNTATFKGQMVSYRQIITGSLGPAKVWAYTKLPATISGIAPYNTVISELANEYATGHYINSDTWTMYDSYHWNDAGLLAWGSDFINLVVAALS